MSDPESTNYRLPRKKRENGAEPAAAPAANGSGPPFDPVRLVAAILRRWKVLPLAGVALMVPALALGLLKFKTTHQVTVLLIRREVTTTIRESQFGDAFKPRQVTVSTVTNIMTSPKLLDRVGGLARPPLRGSELLGNLTILPERDTDLIAVTLKSKYSVPATATLINLYAAEVAKLTGQMQADEAAELDKFLAGQIKRADADLDAANKELASFSRDTEFYGADRESEAYLRQASDLEVQIETARAEAKTVDFRINGVERELKLQSPLSMELNKARDALEALRVANTDQNPVVQNALDKVNGLQKQMDAALAAGTNSVTTFRYTDNTIANELYIQLLNLRGQREGLTKQLGHLGDLFARVREKLKGVPEKSQRYARVLARQQSIQATRDLLSGRQREAQVYEQNPPELYRLFAKASEDTVETSGRWKKTIILAIVGLIFGSGAGLVWVCGRELMDLRVVTHGDLKRVTGVAVAARFPESPDFSEDAMAQWRFRAWSQLLRQTGLKNEPQIVLAFTSARPGEGKSTVIGRLRDAARDRQLPIVTITNAPSVGAYSRRLDFSAVLNNPEVVGRHLEQQPGVPLELHHDSRFEWTFENRAAWRRALDVWRQLPSIVLLVELPSMENLKAVLAAEMMPAVVWVTESGRLQQAELEAALETVRSGDVVLTASILNREPRVFSRLGFLKYIGWAPIVLLCLAQPARAALDNPAQAAAASSSPLSPPSSLAPWQRKFTVGAGDIFNLAIYGRTDSVRAYVRVAPDGRISFMEAQSVFVDGLTVDEMRTRLDLELEKFYKHPRTIVTPVEWHSKKYFVLGAVVDRGAYTLDHPLTIIEAVARARGVASGLFEHNTVELADMTRAFIERGGRRLPVDFDKLFHRGDLSQNVAIEPGDYIYFPSGTVNEVYVLGAIRNPGPLGLTSENTLIGVLTVRGGFMPAAYKQHVLVVRGSLEKPETFVINVAAILAGKEKDFVLRPKDIIYVAEKPWATIAEITQLALNSFAQSMTASWAGNYVPQVINNGILPHP